MFSNHQKRAFGLLLTLLSLPFLLLPGYGHHNGEKEEKKPIKAADTKAVDTPLDPVNYYLTVADLDKFQPGRSRHDILKDLHWRADSVEMADCNGRAICAIAYELRQGERSPIGVHAIFVNNKFVKFIHWLPDTVEVPYEGTTWSRPRPLKFGDRRWFSRAVTAKPVSIEDLRTEAKSARVLPKRTGISPCQIIAWLLLGPTPSATKDDYKRNTALRDQFNAGRLDIGITEMQVESILKAKPLEQGKVDGGLYKIYGSNRSFNIDGQLHFSNILVEFRRGKVTTVYSISAGQDWRRNLGESFIDLPKRDGTDSSH